MQKFNRQHLYKISDRTEYNYRKGIQKKPINFGHEIPPQLYRLLNEHITINTKTDNPAIITHENKAYIFADHETITPVAIAEIINNEICNIHVTEEFMQKIIKSWNYQNATQTNTK